MPMALSVARRRRRPSARRAALAGVLLAVVACGCVHPREAVRIDSKDTDAQVRAMKRAVRQQDPSAAPLLVDALDNEDPAVRFYAIGALERMTGDRLGYDYAEERCEKRKPAVDRWRQMAADAAGDGAGGFDQGARTALKRVETRRCLRPRCSACPGGALPPATAANLRHAAGVYHCEVSSIHGTRAQGRDAIR